MNPTLYFADWRVWHPVTSSNVHSIAHYYDPWTGTGILGVRFQPKGYGPVSEYWYYGAGYSVFQAMASSGSAGRFVWNALRGQYRYRRV